MNKKLIITAVGNAAKMTNTSIEKCFKMGVSFVGGGSPSDSYFEQVRLAQEESFTLSGVKMDCGTFAAAVRSAMAYAANKQGIALAQCLIALVNLTENERHATDEARENAAAAAVEKRRHFSKLVSYCEMLACHCEHLKLADKKADTIRAFLNTITGINYDSLGDIVFDAAEIAEGFEGRFGEVYGVRAILDNIQISLVNFTNAEIKHAAAVKRAAALLKAENKACADFYLLEAAAVRKVKQAHAATAKAEAAAVEAYSAADKAKAENAANFDELWKAAAAADEAYTTAKADETRAADELAKVRAVTR